MFCDATILYVHAYTVGARNINALKVECNNVSNGCQWTGELRELDAHFQSCDYTLLPCTNECTNNDQVVKVLRKDLQDHLNSKCPRRQHICPHCEETGEHQKITTTHLKNCPNAFFPCRNEGCGLTFLRSEISTHQPICQYKRVPCKYAEVGCEERPLRKDLKSHEEDDQLHLRVTAEAVLELKKELAKQNTQILVLASMINSLKIKPQVMFQLTEFRRCKSEKKPFHSPPFYTSLSGYRMCIRVYANGAGDGRGSHISVFCVIMKGDYDHYLTWPFSGTVTIQLLNQLKDENHHERLFKYRHDQECSKRVFDDQLKIGKLKDWGKFKYISYDSLDYQPAINCQYLKDDSLIFRVFVEIPNHKSWLECM